MADPANDQTACPKCSQMRLVDRKLALTISGDRLSHREGVFFNYMRQFKKNRLIAHVVWEREKFSRGFFDDYQPLHMPQFLSYSLLIKRLMIEHFDGSLDANENNTSDLVTGFSRYLDLLTDHIYLEEGFAELEAKEPFDVNSLSIDQKLSNFNTVYTENYLPLKCTFANNEIYPREEALRKAAEYREEWERIKKNPNATAQVTYVSPQDFIKQNYSILNSIHCGLLKNVLYAKTFDFENYKGILVQPAQVMEVANAFSLVRNIITVTALAEFQGRLAQVFKDKADQARSVLLFSEDNAQAFPLFVLLEGRVFISHRTAYLIYLLLHPIILNDDYYEETVIRSKELETTRTKDAFENAGYKWIPSVTDKKKAALQIDGLAGRNGTLFVVEVKGWGLTTFYEHRNKQEYLLRDLKGIVDGKKYRMKEGKLVGEDIPSLCEKIGYAKNNMHKHGFDPNVFKVVKGVIVIEDFPLSMSTMGSRS